MQVILKTTKYFACIKHFCMMGSLCISAKKEYKSSPARSVQFQKKIQVNIEAKQKLWIEPAGLCIMSEQNISVHGMQHPAVSFFVCFIEV